MLTLSLTLASSSTANWVMLGSMVTDALPALAADDFSSFVALCSLSPHIKSSADGNFVVRNDSDGLVVVK